MPGGLPADAKNKEGALRLLRTIGSPEAQRVIARKKGALSPRADVEPAAVEVVVDAVGPET